MFLLISYGFASLQFWTSRDDKKDIVPKNLDFIEVFCVPGTGFSVCRFVDIKGAFSLSWGIRTLVNNQIQCSTDSKWPVSWVNKTDRFTHFKWINGLFINED